MDKSVLSKAVVKQVGSSSSALASRTLDQQWQRLERMSTRDHLRVFAVQAPTTIFIRGTRCRVRIEYHSLPQVEIHARLLRAFGLRFVTAQDEAGVYVIVKRRRLLGWFSRAEFTVKVPDYANLAFNLKAGTILLDGVEGIIEIPPIRQQAGVQVYEGQAALEG